MTNAEIKQIQPCSHKLQFHYNEDSRVDFLLVGCTHIDSKYADLKLLKKHLDDAVSRNALIIFTGDNVDAMQGRDDRRSQKRELRGDLAGAYFDNLVDSTIEFLKPYAHHIAIFATGNHELSIYKHHETNLVKRIVYGLNALTGSNVQVGGYSGYLRIMFSSDTDGNRHSYLIYYSHSSGSLGLRSKGSLAFDILAAKYPSADIYVTAHSHDAIDHPFGYEYVSNMGVIKAGEKRFLQLPSYKYPQGDPERINWDIETNKNPRVTGGWWLWFYYGTEHKMTFNAMRAK